MAGESDYPEITDIFPYCMYRQGEIDKWLFLNRQLENIGSRNPVYQAHIDKQKREYQKELKHFTPDIAKKLNIDNIGSISEWNKKHNIGQSGSPGSRAMQLLRFECKYSWVSTIRFSDEIINIIFLYDDVTAPHKSEVALNLYLQKLSLLMHLH